MTKRGFTLVELLVALVMMGIVSASIYQLLVSNQRVYRQQTQRVELNDNLRSAIAILPSELRELNATDRLGGDIVELSDSSITYKAMRNLYIACSAQTVFPSPVGNVLTGSVLYLDTATVGLRGLDASRDSVLIFADSTTGTPRDDFWRHSNVASVASGNNCPGGRPSINVTFSSPLLLTDSILEGSPVRGFEILEMRRYPDASGNVWLGARQLVGKATNTWSNLQPLVGPLMSNGLQFSYFDAAGVATTNIAQVARISIRVIGRTTLPVQTSSGAIAYVVDTLTTQVALRNNR